MKRSISFRPTLLALVLATNFPVAHAAVPKDMLVIGKAADPQTLDPAVTIDNNDWTVTYPSYQRLVQYKTDGDKGSTDVEGDLASSWKASDDQKEWTFTLRGSKLKPGQSLTIGAGSSAQRLANNSDSITYRVRKGDSLSSIAKRHGVNIKDVMRWNSDTANLQPGDKLTLFVKNNNMPDS